LSFDLVISNGLVVRPQGSSRTNIGITNGVIEAISNEALAGREVIDATGLVVMPGAVDLHVHFSEPGRTHWEGWWHGSRAAAAGGVTTVIEMPLNAIPATTTLEALHLKLEAAKNQSFVDFALWGGLVDDNLEHLPALATSGVIGFKAFMVDIKDESFQFVPEAVLRAGMLEIAARGHFLAVHAEDSAMAWTQTEVLQNAGRTDRRAWLEARSPEVELAAIRTALRLARETNCPLHIVHTSIPEGVDAIAQARAAGQAVTVETCAHYLRFTDKDFERIGPIAKCAPPLRDHARLEGLWDRVLDGTIDCITSDHSPCPSEDKSRGDEDIWQAWGGITGVQSLVVSVLTEGRKRGLSLERTADLLATNPAKIAGLWPRKGEIRVGSDADLILVDLEHSWTLEPEMLHSKHQHSPYVGLEFSALIEQVLVRGQTVFRDGLISGSPVGRWQRKLEPIVQHPTHFIQP
jgi:allantoinase